MSFDMSVLPCTQASDASTLRNYITTYATHPNQLTVNGQVFASTFSGSDCTFGQGSAQQGWSTQFLNQLTGQNAVHFVPSFFSDTSSYSQFDGVMDGTFNVSISSHPDLAVGIILMLTYYSGTAAGPLR